MIQSVPPDQLARRAELLARRRLRVLAERLTPGVLRWPVSARPRPVEAWPAPVFPPRGHLVHDGWFQALDRSFSVDGPIVWSPRDAPPGTLPRIRLHEHEWLEAVDDDIVTRAILSWIHQVTPYGNQYWIDGWNAWAVALRAVVWMQQVAARPALAAHLPEIGRSLAEQLAFLQRNLETDIRGNHLIKDIRALLWGARCFDGADAARWERTGRSWLARELPIQVPPDGQHVERSPAYHLQVFGDLLEIHHVLRAGAQRDDVGAALDRMARAAVATTDPEGWPLPLGDGGRHMAYRAEVLLAAWAARGGAVPPAPPPVTWMEDAGWALARFHPGDLLAVDAGPFATPALPAHGHADALSVLWAVDGGWVFVDTGVFEYQGPRRYLSRATVSHNTVTLDDRDQAELFGVFRAGRTWQVRRLDWAVTPDSLRLCAEHDGYHSLPGAPVHRRRVELVGRDLRIEDEIRGGQGQRAVARLLLHPSVQAVEEGDRWTLTRGALRLGLRASGRVVAVPAPWWPDFGQEVQTTRLELTLGAAPCRGWIRVAPLDVEENLSSG